LVQDSTKTRFRVKCFSGNALAMQLGQWGIKPLQPSDAPTAYLLFKEGTRLTAAQIHAFAAASAKVFVSHDPADGSSPLGNPPDLATQNKGLRTELLPLDKQWVELLRDGLTFDLAGLAPGPACAEPLPAPRHRFDWHEQTDLAGLEAVMLTTGPHLQGGEASMPVLRTMIALVRDLTLFFEEMVAVVWPPSGSLIGRRFFESTATAWLDGGPFPALGLAAFDLAADGALETSGLSLWVGHELRIDPALAQDKVAGTRLGLRLVNHLVMLGGLHGEERITAPDGTRLIMLPASDGGPIRVQRE
jgi:hypothetical protein